MIEHLPSQYPDLSYIPSFLNKDYNYLDGFEEYDHYIQDKYGIDLYHGPIDFTTDNQDVLRSIMENNKFENIVEIGIARDPQSSTQVILDNKKNANYIGIDIRDGSFLHSRSNYVFTILGKSLDDSSIRIVKEVTKGSIDLLMIDGDHSIFTTLNEIIQYGGFVRSGGYIIMHDISHHPVREVFEAVNPDRFIKQRLCLHDYGIGVLQRK